MVMPHGSAPADRLVAHHRHRGVMQSGDCLPASVRSLVVPASPAAAGLAPAGPLAEIVVAGLAEVDGAVASRVVVPVARAQVHVVAVHGSVFTEVG